MGFGNCVLVNNTPSNLEAIGNAGFSYRGDLGSTDLQAKLQVLLDTPSWVEEYRRRALAHTVERYSWNKVAREHAEVYERLLGGSAVLNLQPATTDTQQTEEGA